MSYYRPLLRFGLGAGTGLNLFSAPPRRLALIYLCGCSPPLVPWEGADGRRPGVFRCAYFDLGIQPTFVT